MLFLRLILVAQELDPHICMPQPVIMHDLHCYIRMTVFLTENGYFPKDG